MELLTGDISRIDSCTNFDVNDLPLEFTTRLSNNLSILNLNIRGVKSNFPLLKTFLSQVGVPIKIIVLTESHLDEGVESLFNLSGYRRFTMNRSSFGGGIAAYVHFSLEFKINKDLTGVFASHEALFFTVTCPGSVDIDIFCIYRPPGKNLQPFVGYLNKINSRKFRRKCLVIGDIFVPGTRR